MDLCSNSSANFETRSNKNSDEPSPSMCAPLSADGSLAFTASNAKLALDRLLANKPYGTLFNLMPRPQQKRFIEDFQKSFITFPAHPKELVNG